MQFPGFVCCKSTGAYSRLESSVVASNLASHAGICFPCRNMLSTVPQTPYARPVEANLRIRLRPAAFQQHERETTIIKEGQDNPCQSKIGDRLSVQTSGVVRSATCRCQPTQMNHPYNMPIALQAMQSSCNRRCCQSRNSRPG